MARIPQHFLDDLLGRLDIVELIESRVELKRQGREYTACCPFHNEKTPSFTVSPNKQFYHCFGCGVHGNAIDFVMEYDRLDFRDAIEELAKKAGVQIPEEAGGVGEDRRPLYDALEQAASHYERCLRDAPAAISYLKERGVSGEIARRFRIGYAESGYENLPHTPAALKAHIEAGLLARNDRGGSYARFRDRIMFPIRDTRGRVIAFGGRILPGGSSESGDQKAAQKSAKYLNSPETPLFQKRHHLYGLYEARQASKRLPRALVVEGYMDVVMLAQHGIDYAVATLGTATTPEHLDWLFRNTDQVIFCFDGDAAGRRAADKAMQQSLAAMRDGREIGFLFLPEGEDPDSLVQSEGAQAFSQRIDQAQPLSDFLMEQLLAQTDIGSLDGKARLVELARDPLAALDAPAFRQLFIQGIAERTGMGVNAVGDLLAGRQREVKTPRRSAEGPLDEGVSRLRSALRSLLEYPALATEVQGVEVLQKLEMRGMPILVAALDFFAVNPETNAAAFIEKYRGEPTEQALHRLLTTPLIGDEASQQAVFRDAIALLLKKARKQRIDDLLQSGAERELDEAEKAELTELLSRGS